MKMSKLKRRCTRQELEEAVTLSVPATAFLLDIGESTAYRYVENGLIPVFKLGKRILVKAEWVRQQIALTGDDTGLMRDPDTLPPAA